MAKGENAGTQHFLLFLQCFLSVSKQISIFGVTFILPFANVFNLDQSKILSFGKEFNLSVNFPNTGRIDSDQIHFKTISGGAV